MDDSDLRLSQLRRDELVEVRNRRQPEHVPAVRRTRRLVAARLHRIADHLEP